MKLWDKGQGLKKEIEKFTVGNDYLLDKKLVKYDCLASIAHVKMLKSKGLLDDEEAEKLIEGLKEIIKLDSEGKFEIKQEDEDCHTAIENWLTEKFGDAGKKIHTARSRNDQVLCDIRLYAKDQILSLISRTLSIINRLQEIAVSNRDVWFAGLTHTQPAMPAEVSGWCSAFQILLLNDIRSLIHAYEMNDVCPLGSAAGYGTPGLEIDSEIASNLLGFSKVQKPHMVVQLSRGVLESRICDAITYLLLTSNRIASDLIWMYHPSQGFVSLRDDQTSGSSIMPQKRNPDALELIRASYHEVSASSNAIKNVSAGLVSGYHRDLQIVKKFLIQSLEKAYMVLNALNLCLDGITFEKKACRESMIPEIFATHLANQKVLAGVPFRDAYQMAANEIQGIDENKINDFLQSNSVSNDLDNDITQSLNDHKSWYLKQIRHFENVKKKLTQ